LQKKGIYESSPKKGRNPMVNEKNCLKEEFRFLSPKGYNGCNEEEVCPDWGANPETFRI
jgi:hypothetical protein